MRAHASNARIVLFVAIVLTVLRSLTPLIEQQLNSDEALLGLMAKHMLEGRAFPLHLYSLPHMLGIGAWIAAPFFAVGGPTVVMLKLPLVLMNVAIAWLLVDRLQRDGGLAPMPALIASLPFILAPPVLGHLHYLDAGGGNPEPLLFVLILWLLRHRPLAFGVVLGVALLNRPFAIYGALALLVVQWWDRSLFRAATWKGWLTVGVAVIAIWTLTDVLRAWSSPRGPETSFDGTLPDTLAANAGFVCFEPSTILSGNWRFASDVLPYMLGASTPLPFLPYIVLAVPVVLGARLFWVSRRQRDGAKPLPIGFALYLTIAGMLSAEAYVVARCGVVDLQTMRYALLTPLAFIGVLALCFSLEPSSAARTLIAVVVCVWGLALGAQHARLLVAAASHRPTSPRRELARYMEQRGM